MILNKTLLAAALLMTTGMTVAHAVPLPPECSSALIQYRGNYYLNDVDAQIKSANRYRTTLVGRTAKADKSNLARIEKRIKKLKEHYLETETIQRDCMGKNPEYNSGSDGGGGDVGGGDGGYGGPGSGGM